MDTALKDSRHRRTRLNEDRTRITLELPPELREQLERIATSHERSLSAEVRVALRHHADRFPPTGEGLVEFAARQRRLREVGE